MSCAIRLDDEVGPFGDQDGVVLYLVDVVGAENAVDFTDCDRIPNETWQGN